MTYQEINIGSAANDGTGDPLRTAFGKVNDNFSELYGLAHAFSPAQFGTLGTADDSAAAAAAISAAVNAGGGTIVWPVGAFFVHDLPTPTGVRHVGQGGAATILKPPTGSTTAIFEAKNATALEGVGWSHMALVGEGRASGQTAINLSAASRWDSGESIGLLVNGFGLGIKGSQNDRRPFFSFCRFWNCEDAFYVVANHPNISNCDFRDNGRALTGLSLYDMQIDACAFVRNDYGIVPDDGGTIRQTMIIGSQFFGNYILGARVNERVSFGNCLLAAGVDQDANSVGIEIAGPNCNWIGGVVRGEIVDGFGDAAFVVSSGPGEYFMLAGVSLETRNVLRTSSSDATVRGITITGCSGTIKGYLADLRAGANGVQMCNISDNNVNILTNAPGVVDGFIHINLAQNTVRNTVARNSIWYSSTDITAPAIKVDKNGTNVIENVIRRVGAGIEFYNSGGGGLSKDNTIDGVTA